MDDERLAKISWESIPAGRSPGPLKRILKEAKAPTTKKKKKSHDMTFIRENIALLRGSIIYFERYWKRQKIREGSL